MLSYCCLLILLPQYKIPQSPQIKAAEQSKEKKLFTCAVLVRVITCRKMNVSIPGIVLAGTSNQSASAQCVTRLDFTMRQSNASLKFNYCVTLCCSFLLMSNQL